MSYTPWLVIKKDDLEKNRIVIEDSQYKKHKSPYMATAWLELRGILSLDTIEFPELRFVIATPEGTIRNRNVRRILKRLNIGFQVK
jgi:hypothetical protein